MPVGAFLRNVPPGMGTHEWTIYLGMRGSLSRDLVRTEIMQSYMSQNLPTVVELGRKPKMDLPDDFIRLFAINALNLKEIREEWKKQLIPVSRMTISKKFQGGLVWSVLSTVGLVLKSRL